MAGLHHTDRPAARTGSRGAGRSGHPDDRRGVAVVGQSDGRSAGPCLLLLALAASAQAQVAPNRTTLYLHPTEVGDARALWVNPAGLGRFEEASVHLDLTVGDPGASGRLRQVTLG